MKAVRIATGRPIAPWGDAAGEVRVLDEPLARVQERVLSGLGIEVVTEPPSEPHVVFSDRSWFTADAVRGLIAAGTGRLRVDHAGWWEATGAQQRTPEPGLYELALHPGGPSPIDGLPAVSVDLGLVERPPMATHPAFAHAVRPMWVGTAMVHSIDHWTHVLRVNLLALAALAEEGRRDWERAPSWSKAWRGLGVLLRAGSTNPWRVAGALSEVSPRARVHPTAVVEVSRVGEDAEIGPFAVVRGSVVGKGARVEEHTTVNLSVVGEGAKVGRFAMVNLCVLYPGAQASSADGWQACVIGRDAFLAWGGCALDLSFGAPVRVEDDGAWVSSGQHFLGAAIGHRAKLGYAVRLQYGTSVPNDALIVAGTDALYRSWGDAPTGEPVRIGPDGRPVRVR